MPLTETQMQIAKLLSRNRTPDSHLAGGAALHLAPNSSRYSKDLDYFHDSVERVARAFADDEVSLREAGYRIEGEIHLPGYIRAQVLHGKEGTKVEWSHDSAWRFLPALSHPDVGYVLHPMDLAINKVLALAGRDEPRDYLDTLAVHRDTLSLGALVWAAVGKDPGFTPDSLLELLKRRGKYREEDFQRLRLTFTPSLPELKETWLDALEGAEKFIRSRPVDEVGCLYFSPKTKDFFAPSPSDECTPHYGRPGGVLPRIPSGNCTGSS